MIEKIKITIYNFLKKKIPNKILKFSLEVPTNIKYGDLSTNVLLIYGISFKEELILILSKLTFIKKIEFVGFLNFFFYSNILLGINYKKIKNKKNKIISIEYASPNPTGPCHIGHGRGAIIGDILANIFLYLGYNVKKEFYFNNDGKQVEIFLESIFFSYEKQRGKEIEEEKILYKGNYIHDIAKKYLKEDLDKKNFFLKKKEILEEMKKSILDTLLLLNIIPDIITAEDSLEKEKKICFKILEEKNLLDQIDNKILFKSTYFNDDKDRVIKREDGSFTYFGNDIAYHFKKKIFTKTNFQIIVLGDDHVGYLKRLVSAVSFLDIDLKVVTHNLVKIIKNQQELKMSKRNGTFLSIKDFINKYASADLLRILLIENNYNSLIVLDLDNLSFEDSSLFFLLKTYEKLKNFLKFKIYKKNLKISILDTELDRIIINDILFWPEFITNLTKNLEVHLLLNNAKNFCKHINNYLWKNNIINLECIDEKNVKIFLMQKAEILLKDMLNILKIKLI